MSLYPSLEDMQVDEILKSESKSTFIPPYPTSSLPFAVQPSMPSFDYNLYPSMNDYMGLDLTAAEKDIINKQQEELRSLAIAQTNYEIKSNLDNKMLIAPLSINSDGFKRAQIQNGIRKIVLCKGQDDKIGMRCKSINNGIFVVLVIKDSPAALGGLRFGDQILQINDQFVAGLSHQKIHTMIKKLPGQKINLVVRDRPFERTITIHKDQNNSPGFIIFNGVVKDIIKDSSAARNGLLTGQNILEINGQNVVGLPDKKINEIIKESENTITFTLMPSQIYDHMMKKMAFSLVKKLMDHTLHDY